MHWVFGLIVTVLASTLVTVGSTAAMAMVVPGFGEVYGTYQLEDGGPVTPIDPTVSREWDPQGPRWRTNLHLALPLVAKGGGVIMDDPTPTPVSIGWYDRQPGEGGPGGPGLYMIIQRPSCPPYICYGEWAVNYKTAAPGPQRLHVTLDESLGMEFARVESVYRTLGTEWETAGRHLIIDLKTSWHTKYASDYLKLHTTPLPAPVAFLGTAMAALWTWRRFGHGAAGRRGRRETG